MYPPFVVVYPLFVVVYPPLVVVCPLESTGIRCFRRAENKVKTRLKQ